MNAIDRFDQLDRRIADALEEIAMPQLPTYLDDVFRQTARTAQRSPRTFLERFPPMNRLSIMAATAVLAVAFVGGALLLARSTPPTTGATPSPTVVGSPSPSPTLPITPAAQTLLGDWVADANLGLPDQGSRIQMSIDWQAGKEVWIQTNYTTGTQVFKSNSVAAPTGQLRLVAENSTDGCTNGDVGTYGWSRSTNGEFLTLTSIADQCSARSTALARTWVHTLSAVTDGGLGVLPADNLELTLPNRKFGLGGRVNAPDDTTFDSPPFVEFLAMRDPDRFLAPCSATDRKPIIGTTSAADAVAYIRGLPGFSMKTATATIDGHPATHLTGTPKTGVTCAAGEIGLFPFLSSGGADWTIALGAPLSVWITETGGHAYLFWYHGDQITPADEAAVVGSIHFITSLPTP